MPNLDRVIECHFSESLDTIDKRYTAHPKYEMFILLDGDVTMLINSTRYHITNGAVVLLTSKDLHISINNVSTVYKRITIMFDHHMLQMFNSSNTNLLKCFKRDAAGTGNIFYLSPEQMEFVITQARIIADCQGSTQYGDDLEATASLIHLLININRICQEKGKTQRPLETSPLIENIVQFVNQHIEEDLSIGRIAQSLSYSESYISSLFSKQMGVSLKRYILTRQTAHAKTLIRDGLPMMTVCARCGFNDYSNFSRTFREINGLSPREYKNRGK